MDKKFIISLGVIVALAGATISAYADTTIYTDSIGRMHFLGKDAKSYTGTEYNFSNSAEQDLTRKLYEQAANGANYDTSYDQHPLKNYENTFPDSRFGTSKYWKTKFGNSTDDATVKVKDTVRATATATKGVTDTSTNSIYGSTILDNPYEAEKNVVKSSHKKHWWNKK